MYDATYDDSYLQFAERLQSENSPLRFERDIMTNVVILEYLNEYFLAQSGSTATGYYSTPSVTTPGMPGPLLRLKTGTESATPSVNGVIARNLLRLSALLGDESYRTLARQTCNTFAVEIIQHPFLFVGMLDVIVGLQIGTRTVTGVFSTADISSIRTNPRGDTLLSRNDEPVSALDLIRQRVRAEAGVAVSSSIVATSIVDIRPSHLKDFVGNQSFWLKSRNALFQDLKAGEPAKNYLMVCEAGRCRIIDL